MFTERFRLRAVLAVTLGAQLAVVGCSSNSSETTASPQPVSSETGQYSSIGALQTDFIAAGGKCESGVNVDFRHAKAGIDCGDGYTNLLLFENKAKAVEWAQAASALCNNMVECDGGTLVGTNWAIVTQAPELFREALGGTIIE